MPFHAIAILSGDRQKILPNRNEGDLMSTVVMPFVATGVITAKWGERTQSYQVLELRIYETKDPWDRRNGPLADLIKGKKNLFKRFSDRAGALLSSNKPKIFVITPIQGEKHGDQEQQRIFREYDERFEAVERVIADAGGVAIRIDKEHALEDLVGRIKKEIRSAQFIVADLTDERPSCYFEAGYAEALGKPVIYVASKQSVIRPGTNTRIHFDIHTNVNYFSNHRELKDKLSAAIVRNREMLFDHERPSPVRAD
jgi:nucleoside 2-deoxyribosyltransferase